MLIAEADEDLRDCYRLLGNARGFSVSVAANGVDCLKRIATAVPDAMIVDLDLLWGGADGLLACVQDEFDTELLPNLLVTGFEPLSIISKRSGVPMTRCFRKPFRPSKLLDSVQELLADVSCVTRGKG